MILRSLGGNPVCENQSFPFPNLCSYSGLISGPSTWQQQTSCSNRCNNNTIVHPTTCNCSYPFICNMSFAWTPTFGLDGARIGDLRQTLASGLNVSVEDLWIQNATYLSQTQLSATVFFYPPAGAQKWDRSQVTLIEFELDNKTIKLPSYAPYELVSSNFRTLPLNGGKENSVALASIFWHLKEMSEFVPPFGCFFISPLYCYFLDEVVVLI